MKSVRVHEVTGCFAWEHLRVLGIMAEQKKKKIDVMMFPRERERARTSVKFKQAQSGGVGGSGTSRFWESQRCSEAR